MTATSSPSAVHVTLRRTGTRQGVARNDRGVEIAFGPVETEASFTPGELLAAALGACTLMSSDQVITRRLGADAEVTVDVTNTRDLDNNRYLQGEVVVSGLSGLSSLDAQAQQELAQVLVRAVQRSCTIGRTLEHGLPHTVTVSQA